MSVRVMRLPVRAEYFFYVGVYRLTSIRPVVSLFIAGPTAVLVGSFPAIFLFRGMGPVFSKPTSAVCLSMLPLAVSELAPVTQPLLAISPADGTNSALHFGRRWTRLAPVAHWQAADLEAIAERVCLWTRWKD